MISDVIRISSDHSEDYEMIVTEAEKSALYCGLAPKQALRLRLLAEELVCLLPHILQIGDGEFYIEEEDNEFELHVTVNPEDYDLIDREKIISISSSGKNAAAKGIINKICIAVECLLAEQVKAAKDMPYDFYGMGMSEYGSMSSWSLMNYRDIVYDSFKNEGSEPDDSENASETAEKWDELEKSILGKLADDVTVGIIDNMVEIVVKKKF